MDAVTSVSGKLFEEGWSRVRGSRQGLGAKKHSYGILRVAKVKSMGNMAASLQHTFRERETPNADERLRGENTILMGAPTSAEVLETWKARAPEKIRANAVHGLEYFVGGSPERMNAMSVDEQDRYFADALDWIVRERGARNVLSAVVHRDESTPHMSVMTIPLDENDKLNARSIVGNRGKLSQMQTDFADQVSEKYGLKRGVKGSLARHERVKRAYGTVMGEKEGEEAPALPERVRGSLLRGRGESEAQWRERAEVAMRGALSAQERAHRADMRDAAAKMNVAGSMVENLNTLAEALKAQLDATKDKLDRLVGGLELAGLGKETNAALENLAAIETRIEAGDLGVIEDAVGSPAKLERVEDAMYRLFPEGTEVDGAQAQFYRALNAVFDAQAEAAARTSHKNDTDRITTVPRNLPHLDVALARIQRDPDAHLYPRRDEDRALRAEIETALPRADLEALRAGDDTRLDPLFADLSAVSDLDRMRLTLVYMEEASEHVAEGVRTALVDRVFDEERAQREAHREVDAHRGPRH
ncbi:MAG: MobV family relaxase [Jannaschia sp.]